MEETNLGGKMFKRTIQMEVVKPPKANNNDNPTQTTPVDLEQIARESAREVVKGVVVIISSYMAADTLRRIAIHIAATKIH